MTGLSELFERFGKLGPGTNQVGAGGDSARVGPLLARYPLLAERHPAYVEFLRQRGGAYYRRTADRQAVDLFGFDLRMTDLLRDGNPRRDGEEGLLMFALMLIPVAFGLQVDFAFDAEGRRAAGIYRRLCGVQPGFERYGATFTEWLEQVVRDDDALYH